MLTITLKTRHAERTYPLYVNDYGLPNFLLADRDSVDAMANSEYGIAPECIEAAIWDGGEMAGSFDGALSDGDWQWEAIHHVVKLDGVPCDAAAMYAFCDEEAKK
jgi:hypothetical protein